MKLSARRGATLVAALLLAPAALTACGSTSKSSDTSASKSNTSVGVAVTGGFGEKPTLTVPGTSEPTKLTTDVLKQGDGPAVASGQSLVVNYLGQTWKPKDGKPNVFDNSYDKKAPVAFPIGKQQVIKGWDQALVGQKAGTRVLLTIPGDLAYPKGDQNHPDLAGQTLLFVVDVLGAADPKGTATGAPATALPKGFPAVQSASGAVPTVTSVKGVTLGKAPQSALLIKGSGPAIDEKKNLLIQLLQVDAKTGKTLQSTWATAGPQILAGADALKAVTALKGAGVGSRAVVLSPQPAAGQQGVVVVVDVLNEF